MRETTNPGIKQPKLKAELMHRPHERCRRCYEDYTAVELQRDPLMSYYRVCADVHSCHRRMMRPKLRVLPGGARY